jgi:hypothetical protein
MSRHPKVVPFGKFDAQTAGFMLCISPDHVGCDVRVVFRRQLYLVLYAYAGLSQILSFFERVKNPFFSFPLLERM